MMSTSYTKINTINKIIQFIKLWYFLKSLFNIKKGLFMKYTVEGTDTNFDQEVLKSDIPVLVDFWAPWCMPCKMMAPILDEIAGELVGQVKIAKVNSDAADNQALAQEYQVQSIPNLKLFKDGKVIAEFIGLRDKDTLKQEITTALAK